MNKEEVDGACRDADETKMEDGGGGGMLFRGEFFGVNLPDTCSFPCAAPGYSD